MDGLNASKLDLNLLGFVHMLVVFWHGCLVFVFFDCIYVCSFVSISQVIDEKSKDWLGRLSLK